MPKQIRKRDGCLETWSTQRIAQAILKALKASGVQDPILATRLAGKVEGKLEELGNDVPEQEHVQDAVELVLMESRLFAVARRYIVYREKRRELREQKAAFLDIADVIDAYATAAANAQADVNADGAASSVEALENRNMLTVGYVAATAALARTESRGAHARTDHSEPVDNWAHSVAYIKD